MNQTTIDTLTLITSCLGLLVFLLFLALDVHRARTVRAAEKGKLTIGPILHFTLSFAGTIYYIVSIISILIARYH